MDRIKKLNTAFARILEECPELTLIGNEVLRKPTNEVSFEEGLEIAEELKKTLGSIRDIAGYGRGLAAPQIGKSKSVFVTYVDDKFEVYINPIINRQSTKQNCYRESCLSSGYLFADVKRPASITITYTNQQGDTKEEKVGGFLARLLQHEYDHLQGIVNIDVALPKSIEIMASDPLEEKLREC